MDTIAWRSGIESGPFSTLEHLQAADRRYTEPLLEAEHDPRIWNAWCSQGRIDISDGTLAVLPSSSQRLLSVLEQFVVGDLITFGRNEPVLEAYSGVHRAWTDEDISGQTLMLSIPGPDRWLDVVASWRDQPPARVIARVRAPLDGWFSTLAASWTTIAYRRDIEHYVTPGPWVLDGGGDVWVLEDISLDALNRDNLPQHAWRDVDSIDPQRCNLEGVRQFIDRIIERFGESAVFNEQREHRDGFHATLRFASGRGFQIELNPAERHLLISFDPYDASLETTALSSVYECFGLAHTRSRPVRTLWSPRELVF